MDKLTISGNGTLRPVLWVGASLRWPTSLASTDPYVQKYWRAALSCLESQPGWISEWDREIMAEVRP